MIADKGDEQRRIDRAWDRVSRTETTETVYFSDANGAHSAIVGVDGEFWRVVTVRTKTPFPPEAARRFARAILKAADRAEREEKQRKRLAKLERQHYGMKS